MKRRGFLQRSMASFVALQTGNTLSFAHAAELEACDVLVYGSTPGGIAAAIEAARRGCKVLLACPKKHAGGMSASGLSTTDAVRKELFGGLMIEFIDQTTSANGNSDRRSPDVSVGRRPSDQQLL